MIHQYDFSMVLAIIVVCYLIGSIPTAYLAAKLHKVNIFDVGSGNMGATNVVRAMGMRWGIAVMLFDIFKGVAAIFISRQMLPENTPMAMTVASIAVICGHNWSFLVTLLTGKLRGGKGAATAYGTMLMMAPIHIGVSMLVIGVVIIVKTRLVSLGVLAAFAIANLWMMVLILQEQLPSMTMVYTLLLTLLILFRFKENIQRLIEGRERRLGDHA